VIVICASASLLGGCGKGSQKREAQKLVSKSVLSSTAPLSARLIKESEIDSASNPPPVRTFLRLWSLLQFQSWNQAEELFQPGLREAIGAPLLAQGLAAFLVIWQGTKPHVVSVHVVGPNALISFLARDEADGVIPASISLQRTGESWLVSYFSLLDGALQRSVQSRVQAQIDPLATKPAPHAIREGIKASQLQSTYLESAGRASSAAKRGGARP
jgi:hypothetical protein